MIAMSIGKYIKEIGRGKDGARALTRAQSADLLGQVLDGQVSDLEIGAFCVAMRIKGETPQEMLGFLDATHARLSYFTTLGSPCVVLPSYNGARKLPGLLPLLAILLGRAGLPVLIHGMATETRRIYTSDVLQALGINPLGSVRPLADGEVVFAPTSLLCPGLMRLLEVRQTIGLRNSSHSLVKLMMPVDGKKLLVTSYTHPDYALSMAQTLTLQQANALLLHGTEGEPVADARRTPRMVGFLNGVPMELQEAQAGSLRQLPELPSASDALSTASYIRSVLQGSRPVPEPIAKQVAHILYLVAQQ